MWLASGLGKKLVCLLKKHKAIVVLKWYGYDVYCFRCRKRKSVRERRGYS